MREQIHVPIATAPLRGHLPLGDDHVAVTSRYLERDGVPILPVSAEVHFSRLPREVWADELAKIRASGVTVLATYVIWVHHEPRRGQLSFEGQLDLGEFLRLCRENDLEILLRIGPWAHAEARNGGFPDWLLEQPMVVRSDDPVYLVEVDRWYRAIAQQIAGIPLFGVQVENELYDDAAHLATLLYLARSAGIHAPIWTGTAWGGAQLPVDRLLPLYAGYSEAFWIAHDADEDLASASNFYFSDERDEVGVGADTRDSSLQPSNLDPERYPYATCELGGGMVSAYHRRPTAPAEDIAALALTKLGSGSTWQGYYMFHDGVNPARSLQESHATGARNDLPELSYDFNAPLGVYGEARPSLGMLRAQHLAIEAFGERIAPLPLVLPQGAPSVGDTSTLRWAVRSDGHSGFLFVNNRQPHTAMPAHDDVRFAVNGSAWSIEFPPVRVASGAHFFWPFRFSWQTTMIEWVTAQLLTEVSWRGAPLLIVTAEGTGILKVAGHEPVTLAPGRPVDLHEGDGDRGRVLLLDTRSAQRATLVDGRLVIADGVVTPKFVYVETPGARLEVLTREGFVTVPLAVPAAPPPPTWHLERQWSGPAPVRLGPWDRASAPLEADYSSAARYVIDLAALPASTADRRLMLEIEWVGDVARALVSGELVDDRYFTGRHWMLPLDRLGGASEVTIELLPLSAAAPIHLPEWARASCGDADVVGEIRSVRVHQIVRQPLPVLPH